MFQDIENEMIKNIMKNQKSNDNDYYNEKNVLVCGKCHTEKEYITPSGRKIPCLCECRCRELEQEEKEYKKKDFIRNNIRYIDIEYRNIYFKDVNELEQEYNWSYKFVNEFETFKKMNTGLYIFGEVGNGKTTIASAIANELLERQYRVMMIPTNQAIYKINNGDGNTQENINHFKQTLLDMDLIVLDDFGATRETAYQLEKIYNLINFLYENRKVIIITSNITRKDLGEETDLTKKRIFDRIIEMTYGCFVRKAGLRKELAKDKQKMIKEIFNKGE